VDGVLISDNISLQHFIGICPYQKTLLFWQLIIILSCLIKEEYKCELSSEYAQTQYAELSECALYDSSCRYISDIAGYQIREDDIKVGHEEKKRNGFS
jgi:hypothetical protein